MNKSRMISPTFQQLTGIRHAFLTRNLKGSSHIYSIPDAVKARASDPATQIERNLKIAQQNLGFPASKISVLNQSHSTRVITIDDTEAAAANEADAQVTNLSGIGLGVLTADCVPVLLADPIHRVIGAAHAGWKGANDGIIEATIERMNVLGAKVGDMTAAIGPCIGWDSYEVGPEFIETFLARTPASQIFFKASTRPDHFLFDLPGFVTRKLRAVGLREVHDVGCDTYANPNDFFSYRRQTHKGEGFLGNLLSVVLME